MAQRLEQVETEKDKLCFQLSELQAKHDSIQSKSDEDTTQQISSAKEEVSNFSADVSKLEASIEALSRERDTAIGKMNEIWTHNEKMNEILELDIVEYRSLLSHVANVEATSKDAIATLEESVRQKTDEACALNEIVTSSNAQIAHVTVQCSALTEERDEVLIKLEEVTKEKDELAKRLAAKEEEVSNYSADVSKLEASIEALGRERDTAIEKMNEILNHNGVTEVALSSLKNENDELASTLVQMKADVSHLEAEKEEVVASLRSLQENIVALNKLNVSFASQSEAATATFDANVSAVEELELYIVEYRTLLSDHANVEAKSKDAIANLEESVRQKTDEACALNEIITSSNAQIAHVTVQCSVLTEERDEVVIELEEVTKEKDELAKRLAAKEEEVSNYSADVSKLEASSEALSRERDTAIAKMKEILSHNGVTEVALSCLKNEKDKLASTLGQMKADVSHLEAEKENSNAKICTLNATIVDLQIRNSHLVKDIQTSKSELNELLSRSEKSSATHQALQLEMGDCLKQLRLATDEKAQAFTKMPDEKAKWKEYVADLEGSSADKTLQIKEPDELQSTVKSLHINKVDILKSKLDDLQRSLNAKITDLQTDLVAALGEKVLLTEQLKEACSEGRRFVDEASAGGGGAIGTWAHERHRAKNHQPLLRDNLLPLSLAGVHGVANAQPCRRNEDEDGVAIDDRRDECPRSSAQSNNVAEVTRKAKGKLVVDVVYVVNGVEFPAFEKKKNNVIPSLSSVVGAVGGGVMIDTMSPSPGGGSGVGDPLLTLPAHGNGLPPDVATESEGSLSSSMTAATKPSSDGNARAIAVEATEGGKTMMRQRNRKRKKSEVGTVSRRRKRTNLQEEYGVGYKFKKFFVAPYGRVRRLH